MRMPWTSDKMPEPEARAEIKPHSPGHAHVATAGDKALAYGLSLLHPFTWYRFLMAEFRGLYMVASRLRSWINVDDKPQLAQAGQRGALQHAAESRLRRLALLIVVVVDLSLLLVTVADRVPLSEGFMDFSFSPFTILWGLVHFVFFFIVGRDGPVLNRVQTARMTGEYLIRSVVNEITIPVAKMKDNPSVTTVLAAPVARLATNKGFETTVRIHDQGDPTKLLSYAGTTSLAHKLQRGRQTVYTYKVAQDQSLVRIMILDTDPWTLEPTRHPMALHPRPFNIWHEKASLGYHPGSFAWVEPLIREGKIRNLLIGGSPGTGKSVLLRDILMYLAVSPVHIHLIDGKSVDFLPIKRIAKSYVGETDMEDEALLRKVIVVLTAIKAEVNRRKSIILKSAEDHGTPTYLTEEMAHTLGMLPEALVIDELATFTEELIVNHKKAVQEILSLISYIASKGRAFGVWVILATQRPNDKSVPSSLRGLFIWRTAFYIGNQAGSFAIIEKSGDEYRADKLEAPSADDDSMDYRLVAINAHLRAPVRVHLGRDVDLRFVVDFAVSLRALPTGAVPVPGGRYPEFIEKILEIFAENGSPDRLETAILTSGLNGITPHALGNRLRPFGIESKRWSTGGQDKRGYFLADFERVKRVPGGRVNDAPGTDDPADSVRGPSDGPDTSQPPEDDAGDWAANTRD